MPNTNFLIAVALVALGSYLLGSINTAIVVCKLTGKDDIRKHGSANAGMTNMLRVYGKGAAAATAFGDFFKAVASVILGRYIFGKFQIELDAGYIAGLFVLLGHSFPLYFGFKGGKGVMSTLGVIASINPIVFGVLVLIFLPVILITRIVSLASIFGSICFPILTFISLHMRGMPAMYDTISAAVIGGIILYMHRGNIKRLLSGTENRFGSKK